MVGCVRRVESLWRLLLHDGPDQRLRAGAVGRHAVVLTLTDAVGVFVREMSVNAALALAADAELDAAEYEAWHVAAGRPVPDPDSVDISRRVAAGLPGLARTHRLLAALLRQAASQPAANGSRRA